MDRLLFQYPFANHLYFSTAICEIERTVILILPGFQYRQNQEGMEIHPQTKSLNLVFNNLVFKMLMMI